MTDISFTLTPAGQPAAVLTIGTDGTLTISGSARKSELRTTLAHVASLYYNEVMWPKLMAERMPK